MNHKNALIIAGIFATLGVALGAFGAHALEEVLSEERLQTWETAVRYQMWHTIGMMALVIISKVFDVNLKLSLNFFLAGILFFSGSLYVLCLSGLGWFGAITPIGGICFISGWLYFIVQIIKRKNL